MWFDMIYLDAERRGALVFRTDTFHRDLASKACVFGALLLSQLHNPAIGHVQSVCKKRICWPPTERVLADPPMLMLSWLPAAR